MNTATPQANKGFSFIEVLLSLVLVASALVTLMALVPASLKASRNATNSIIMAHIFEDAHERLEGHALKDGILDSKPFFYDDEGIFIAPVKPDKRGSKNEVARRERRLYRVDIRLVSPANEELQNNAPGLKAVILTVAWPVNPDTGEALGGDTSYNRKSITYYINALTGSGWSRIDPNFEPLIEF